MKLRLLEQGVHPSQSFETLMKLFKEKKINYRELFFLLTIYDFNTFTILLLLL